MDEVITIGRARIANEAKLLLQDLCNKYEIGIEVNHYYWRFDPSDNTLITVSKPLVNFVTA